MRRILLALAFFSAPVLAENHAQVCEQTPVFAQLFPDYKGPADTQPKLLSWDVISIRAQPPASTACVMLAVDESGVPQDVSAYFLKPIELSKRERKSLLAYRFAPATLNGNAVKSTFVLRVEKSRPF